MARITGSYPDDLVIEGTVEVGVCSGKTNVLREFVRECFEEALSPRSTRRAMFALALMSACNVDTWHSKFLHLNPTCLGRYPICFHEWHVCDVYCG